MMWRRSRKTLIATVYVSKVGTFGVSCASYWWTCISAAEIRATHHLLGPEYMLDLMLYADDLESHMGLGPQYYVSELLLLVCPGLPLQMGQDLREDSRWLSG